MYADAAAHAVGRVVADPAAVEHKAAARHRDTAAVFGAVAVDTAPLQLKAAAGHADAAAVYGGIAADEAARAIAVHDEAAAVDQHAAAHGRGDVAADLAGLEGEAARAVDDHAARGAAGDPAANGVRQGQAAFDVDHGRVADIRAVQRVARQIQGDLLAIGNRQPVAGRGPRQAAGQPQGIAPSGIVDHALQARPGDGPLGRNAELLRHMDKLAGLLQLRAFVRPLHEPRLEGPARRFVKRVAGQLVIRVVAHGNLLRRGRILARQEGDRREPGDHELAVVVQRHVEIAVLGHFEVFQLAPRVQTAGDASRAALDDRRRDAEPNAGVAQAVGHQDAVIRVRVGDQGVGHLDAAGDGHGLVQAQVLRLVVREDAALHFKAACEVHAAALDVGHVAVDGALFHHKRAVRVDAAAHALGRVALDDRAVQRQSAARRDADGAAVAGIAAAGDHAAAVLIHQDQVALDDDDAAIRLGRGQLAAEAAAAQVQRDGLASRDQQRRAALGLRAKVGIQRQHSAVFGGVDGLLEIEPAREGIARLRRLVVRDLLHREGDGHALSGRHHLKGMVLDGLVALRLRRIGIAAGNQQIGAVLLREDVEGLRIVLGRGGEHQQLRVLGLEVEVDVDRLVVALVVIGGIGGLIPQHLDAALQRQQRGDLLRRVLRRLRHDSVVLYIILLRLTHLDGLSSFLYSIILLRLALIDRLGGLLCIIIIL